MLFVLIISQSETFLASEMSVVEMQSIPRKSIITINYDPKADEQDNLKRLEEYDRLFYRVNCIIQSKDLIHNRFIGIVDCRNTDADNAWQLHALREIPGMMILSFPEI